MFSVALQDFLPKKRLLLIAINVSLWGAVSFAAAAGENSGSDESLKTRVEHAADKTGAVINQGAEKTKKSLTTAAESTEHGLKTAAQNTDHALHTAADKTEKALQKTGEKIKEVLVGDGKEK